MKPSATIETDLRQSNCPRCTVATAPVPHTTNMTVQVVAFCPTHFRAPLVADAAKDLVNALDTLAKFNGAPLDPEVETLAAKLRALLVTKVSA